MPTYDETSDAVMECAVAICGVFKTHKSGVFELNHVPFEMGDVAMCSEFVRECNFAASGHNGAGIYFGGTARATEKMLQKNQLQVSQPNPGDIVCFNKGIPNNPWGHIGIHIDGEHFAENTSSAIRGPGFVISEYAEIGRARISGFYRLYPKRVVVEVVTTQIRIIAHDTGKVMATYKMVPDGDHIADQRKLYVTP